MQSADNITIKNFQINLTTDENGMVAPVAFDASSLITDADIKSNHNGNGELSYKFLSLEPNWRNLDETWLKINSDTGLITGRPFLTKIDYNEVSGLLSPPNISNGSVIEFEAVSNDSMPNVLSRDTLFHQEEFINGLSIQLETMDLSNLSILKEAVNSPNLRVRLQHQFNDILDSFNSSGSLIPVTFNQQNNSLRLERSIDEFGILRLQSFDGAVLMGTEIINMPDVLQEAANALQGRYGTMEIDPLSGTYEYDLDGIAARKAIDNSPTGFVTETFTVKYATDNLVSAGVGGLNFNPKTISLENGNVYNLFLTKFPNDAEVQTTEYKPYLRYASGAQVKYAPDYFNTTLKINASLSNSTDNDVKWSIKGAGDDLLLRLEVADQVYESDMKLVDGSRV